jgi:hypothetical protein
MQNQTQNKISQHDSFPARISEANYRKKVPPDYKQNPRPVHPQKTRYPIKSNSQNTKKKKVKEKGVRERPHLRSSSQSIIELENPII